MLNIYFILYMVMLENENILKLIFGSITFRSLKHMLPAIKSTAITRILTRILNYKNIFKTIGKTKSYLYPNHDHKVMSISILPDNKVLSTSWGTTTLTIWNIDNSQCIREVDGGVGVLLPICNRDIIAVSTREGCIKLLNSCNFKCIKKIELRPLILEMFLLSNGHLVCSARLDAFGIIIFDSNKDFELIKQIENFPINALVNLPNGQFATAGFDITIWNSIHYECLRTIKGHSGYPTSLIYDEFYNLLISGSYDNTIKVWDGKNEFTCIKTIFLSSTILCLLSLPSGYFVSGGVDGNIKIWDLCNYECINTIAQGFKVSSIKQSNSVGDGFVKDYRIVSCSKDERQIFVWDI
jgi:WD40 repeat protein